MRAIRSRDTRPELELRRQLRLAGARGYRIHRKSLPGRPDISFGPARVAVFVDGCFWHGCPECFRMPRTRTEFWRQKIERNQARDARDQRALEAMGWTVLRYWECDVRRRAPDIGAQLVQSVRPRQTATLRQSSERTGYRLQPLTRPMESPPAAIM